MGCASAGGASADVGVGNSVAASAGSSGMSGCASAGGASAGGDVGG